MARNRLNVLNKDVKINDDKVVIREEIETVYDINDLNTELRDLEFDKTRIREQNNELIENYNEINKRIEEIKDMISKLGVKKGPKPIGD